MAKSVGQTKDVGFQFGLQKTFSESPDKAWDFLFSNERLSIWLGHVQTDLAPNKHYETNGVGGLIRVFKPYSHIRMSWKKKEWKNTSTVQVRVLGKANNKTVISFHQEKLLDSNQRAEMKEYWNEKMQRLAESLKS